MRLVLDRQTKNRIGKSMAKASVLMVILTASLACLLHGYVVAGVIIFLADIGLAGLLMIDDGFWDGL